MKQSSSTMMSAHTDIDKGQQYVFMSSGLDSSIDLENRAHVPSLRWDVTIKLHDSNLFLPIISLEDEGSDSYIVCLSVNEEIERLTISLLNREELTLTLLGKQFKSKVLKLESARAYLRILR